MDTLLLDELIQICDSSQIQVAALEAALAESGFELEVFCDVLSRRIAHRFHCGTLDYETADAAINNLVAFAFQPPDREPAAYTWAIYHAFDAGEYCHAGDTTSVDPVEKYTRPQIAQILASEQHGA